MKNNWFLILLALLTFASCQKEQEARKPVSYASGSFIRQSVARNKQILKEQEAAFTNLIKKQPNVKILTSKYGFRYYYNQQDTLQTKPLPVKGDVVFFDYEVRNLKNQLIYSVDKFKNRQYQIDKENIMSGLREGLKLLREGDVVTFYFPSQFAYGFHGDGNRISSNTPLIIKVSILKITRLADILAAQAQKAKLDSIAQSITNDSIKRASTSTSVISNTSLPTSQNINTTTVTKPIISDKTTATAKTAPVVENKPLEIKKPEVVLPPRKKVKPIKVPPIKLEVKKESIKNAPVLEQPIILKPTK